MIHAKLGQGKLEILRGDDTTTEIKLFGDYIEIAGKARIEVDDDVVVTFSKAPPMNQPSEDEIRDALRQAVSTFAEMSDKTEENLTNADYVVMALHELGRPMKSVDEIMPILDRNGYTSTAKDRKSAVRYYLSSDKRIVRTDAGWTLEESLRNRSKTTLGQQGGLNGEERSTDALEDRRGTEEVREFTS